MPRRSYAFDDTRTENEMTEKPHPTKTGATGIDASLADDWIRELRAHGVHQPLQQLHRAHPLTAAYILTSSLAMGQRLQRMNVPAGLRQTVELEILVTSVLTAMLTLQWKPGAAPRNSATTSTTALS
jgi:hypothetical protein